jgi:RNA polymerase sigma factor (sigma-70 family)
MRRCIPTMGSRLTPKLRRRARGRDAPLLVQAQRSPELFADFYAEHYEQVLVFFARRTLDPETAFDLMAETFASAFAALMSFRGTTEEQTMAWLWTIARNQLYRWSDRGVVERRCLQQLGVELTTVTTAEFERIEQLAALDQIKPEIIGALQSLGCDQREAVRLRVIDEHAYASIARELGVTEQVARARVSRGLRELARMLKPYQSTLRETVR